MSDPMLHSVVSSAGLTAVLCSVVTHGSWPGREITDTWHLTFQEASNAEHSSARVATQCSRVEQHVAGQGKNNDFTCWNGIILGFFFVFFNSDKVAFKETCYEKMIKTAIADHPF